MKISEQRLKKRLRETLMKYKLREQWTPELRREKDVYNLDFESGKETYYANAIAEYIREDEDRNFDVYNLEPDYEFYDMMVFKVIDGDLEGQSYVVGDTEETYESAKQNLRDLFDDIGYEGLNPNFLYRYLDREHLRHEFNLIVRDMVNDEPEYWVKETDRKLANYQIDEVSEKNSVINNMKKKIQFFQNVKNENNSDLIDKNIGFLESKIEEYERDIYEIKLNPEGDFDDDAIDEAVEREVESRMDDLVRSMEDLGMRIEDYIDQRELVQGILDSDGFQNNLNLYSGRGEFVNVRGEEFFVGRVD